MVSWREFLSNIPWFCCKVPWKMFSIRNFWKLWITVNSHTDITSRLKLLKKFLPNFPQICSYFSQTFLIIRHSIWLQWLPVGLFCPFISRTSDIFPFHFTVMLHSTLTCKAGCGRTTGWIWVPIENCGKSRPFHLKHAILFGSDTILSRNLKFYTHKNFIKFFFPALPFCKILSICGL